tara:strand:+ start:318 stop:548 length:231 start_codon:yes stop_codon:yes gene_type:complete
MTKDEFNQHFYINPSEENLVATLYEKGFDWQQIYDIFVSLSAGKKDVESNRWREVEKTRIKRCDNCGKKHRMGQEA